MQKNTYDQINGHSSRWPLEDITNEEMYQSATFDGSNIYMHENDHEYVLKNKKTME